MVLENTNQYVSYTFKMLRDGADTLAVTQAAIVIFTLTAF